MHVAVYVPVVFAVVFAALAGLVPGALSPRMATWSVVGVGAAVAVTSAWAFVLLSAGFVERGVHLEELSRLPQNLVPEFVSLVAMALLGLAVVRVGWVCCSRVRLVRRRVLVGALGSSELIVLPGDELIAFAWPGGGGRIVVSQGMLRSLSPSERRVLLAHERSHLHHGHHRFRIAAQLCAANPLLNRLRSGVELATERWADEDAAAAVDDRPLAARAVARAAIASADRSTTPVRSRGGGSGLVPARVAALQAVAATRRAWARVVALCVVSCGLLACVGAVEATRDFMRIAGH